MIRSYVDAAKVKKYRSIVTQIIKIKETMRGDSSRSLKRRFIASDDRVEKLAILAEMSKRFLGRSPFEVQLIAALAMHDGYVLNMFTGEGKTIAGALAAALFASDGKQVIVTTANKYLSSRDSMVLKPLFNSVGIESGELGRSRGQIMFKSIYDACLDWLDGFVSNTPLSVVQNSFFAKDNTVMIVDEIDYSLIELSMHPVHIVTANVSEYNPDFIYNLVLKAGDNPTFYKMMENGGASLTDSFYEFADLFLLEHLGVSRDELYSTSYGKYIEFQNAYTAQFVLIAGRDYIVDSTEACIKRFNKRTGRSTNGGYERGILNFLHKKEQLTPPTENEEIITSTLKYYIRSFETVVGMSGTSECNRMELNNTYGLKVLKIPPRVPSKLSNLGYAVYKTETEKFKSVLAFVRERLTQDRPVMLVCEDNAMAGKYFDNLSLIHKDVVLILGEDDKSEAELIGAAGGNSQLTITTRLCARGTDIVVDHDEGLSLVVSGLGVTDVDDLQLNGRTARSGKKGEVIFFASAQDSLFSGFKKGSSSERFVLMVCQSEPLQCIDDLDTRLSVEATAIVRRVQLECVKSMREQRKMIIAYQSPIEDQLEIIKKKRFEMWDVSAQVGSSYNYMGKLINVVYRSGDSDDKDQANAVIDRFCALSPNFHNVIMDLLNKEVTALWAEHNSKMRVILADSFGSGVAMDVGKYNNKCHALFDDLVMTFNNKLLDSVVSQLAVFLDDYDESVSLAIASHAGAESSNRTNDMLNTSEIEEANRLLKGVVDVVKG